MNVIGNTADAKAFAIVISHDGCQIGVEIGPHTTIKDGRTILRAEHNMHEQVAQRSRHGWDYRSGRWPSGFMRACTWGFTPRWYIVAPPALRAGAAALTLMALAMLLSGCKSAPAPMSHHMQLPDSSTPTYPARPTTPPAPFKIFHHANSTFTLTVAPNASDDAIAALVWQLRDAARTHTFDTLHIPQRQVDADGSTVWFHIYRGPKCAPEKYAPGEPPCGASYHAAGDYTFAPTARPTWDQGQLNHGESQTSLWNPDAPYTAPSTH
jgi:hypothetical protein